MNKEKLPGGEKLPEEKKQEYPVMPFESLSPEAQEQVLEEMQKHKLRLVTKKESERMKSKYFEYKEGRWQLMKPSE